MNAGQTELSYQKAAVESASPIGLVIILYDKLVSDLKKAIAAMRRNDIESRCNTMNHAMLVLQHLQGSLDMTNGGEAAQSLTQFYNCLRIAFMDAQVKMKPEILEQQIELILQVRQAWNQVECPAGSSQPQSAASTVHTALVNNYGAFSDEFVSASWSA